MASEYALLSFQPSTIEADRATMIGKKAYFYTTYAYALAAVDDDDPTVATGIVTLMKVNLQTGKVAATDYAYDPYVDITDKSVAVDENGNINVAFATAADRYMVFPDAANTQPFFIPAERLVDASV